MEGVSLASNRCRYRRPSACARLPPASIERRRRAWRPRDPVRRRRRVTTDYLDMGCVGSACEQRPGLLARFVQDVLLQARRPTTSVGTRRHVGQAVDIADRFGDHWRDHCARFPYPAFRPSLYGTWAEVRYDLRDGVERYVGDRLRPGDIYLNVPPQPVILAPVLNWR